MLLKQSLKSLDDQIEKMMSSSPRLMFAMINYALDTGTNYQEIVCLTKEEIKRKIVCPI